MKYCYTFEKKCREYKGADLKDGVKTIFLSTYGENPEDVPEEIWSCTGGLAGDYHAGKKFGCSAKLA